MTTNSKFRAGSLLAVICLASVFLTGCGIKFLPFEPADFPIAIQKDGDTISAVICHDIEADTVVTQIRDRSGGDWVTIFDATGHGEFSAGDELFQSSRIQGMAVTGPSSLSGLAADQFMFMLWTSDSSFTSFFFSAKNLSNESWLHPDGSTSAVPCPED